MILLGVVLILIVLVFNWWQDRRVRRRMQQHFPQRDTDPLMPAGFQEPGRREPALGVHVVTPDPESPQADDEDDYDDPDEVDPSTEAVIDIRFAQPVETVQLYQALEPLRRVGSKPVRVFAESTEGLHRSALRPGEAYVSLQLAVLLANRNGALSAIEWSQLWSVAEKLAEQFDGGVEGPDQAAVMRQAADLDKLCASIDAQVGLALSVNNPQRRADVLKALHSAGFVQTGSQLAWVSEHEIPRFTVLFDGQDPFQAGDERVVRVELLLDLPNSPSDDQAFSRMASVGRDLARRLGATLLDDQGNPVSDQADDTIDRQLQALYAQLEKAGFTPGDPRTSRVFS
jgi:hypothetical protein